MKKVAYVIGDDSIVKFGETLPKGAFLLARDVSPEKEQEILVHADTLRDGKNTPFVMSAKIAASAEDRLESLKFFRKWATGCRLSRADINAQQNRVSRAYAAIAKKAKKAAA